VPPWLIGQSVTSKADQPHLTCYFRDQAVATHLRCWQRQPRLELPQHREAAPTHHRRHGYAQKVAALLSLGDIAQGYLAPLATTNAPLTKQGKQRLALKDADGPPALLDAMPRATRHQAFGAHYSEHLRYQEMTPQRQHPPVRLKQAQLTAVRLEEPARADYEAWGLSRTRA
jgi:hypothetical protein